MQSLHCLEYVYPADCDYPECDDPLRLQPTGFHLVFVKAWSGRLWGPPGGRSLGGQFLARLEVVMVLGLGDPGEESRMNHPLRPVALRTRSKEAPHGLKVPAQAESSLSLAAMHPLS